MYGKVFDSIYDGTLAGHWEAIVTMQQLIVLATPDGVVDMTPQAIAARTTIPLDIITKGLQVLSEPDPFTRTPGEEGRRIVLLDGHRPWGWRLVNHGKYMRLRNMAQKRADDRARIADKRNKIKGVASTSPNVADVAHSDSDLDSNKNQRRPAAARRTSLPDGFAISNRVRQWAKEKGLDAFLDQHFEKFVGSVKARGARYADWDEALIGCIRDDWGDIRRKAAGGRADTVKPEQKCDHCFTPLTGGWTQSPKGRACNPCRRTYLDTGKYPVTERQGKPSEGARAPC